MSSPESILHLKRADLPPSVRSYVDNLNAQVQKLLQDHGVRTLDDFKRLIREKKVRVEAVENMKKLLQAYATAVRTGERPPEDLEFIEDYEDPETGETKEIRLDLNESLQTTSDFFKQFGLDELRAALPKSIHLTDDQKEKVRVKMREGFDLAFVLPPPRVFEAALEHVIEATSMVVTGISKGYGIVRYKQGRPERAKADDKIFSGMRPDRGDPYIFLIKNKDTAPLTYHVTGTVKDPVFARYLRESLAERGETGLSFEEYALFHRFYVETHRGLRPDDQTSTLLTESHLDNEAMLRAGVTYGKGRTEYISVDVLTAASRAVLTGRCRTAVVIPFR